MKTHDLKVVPPFFDALADGRKNFEIRYDDRGFAVGDVVNLREWLPGGRGVYTNRSIRRRVAYIVSADDVAAFTRSSITGGVVLALEPVTDARSVLVFRMQDRVPVFHRFGPWHGREELGDGWLRSEHRTVCGLLRHAVEWRDLPAAPWSEVRLEHHAGVWMRRDHAEKIGRACERCGASSDG